MLNQLFVVTLKLLRFQAGPQDFPYSLHLTRTVVLVTFGVSYLQYRLTLPPLVAAVHALVTLMVMAGFTWQVLTWRKVGSRTQQTINSLFVTGSALTVLLLPLLAVIAPQMVEMAANPERSPAENLPALPMLGVMVLSFWSLAVSANIYRHALNLNIGLGLVVSLLAAMMSVSVAGTISGLFLD